MGHNGIFTSIGICGCGKMGISFYRYLLRFQGYSIVFYTRDLKKAIKLKGRNGGAESSARFTDRIEDLGACDIVFEFIPEDIAAKQQVLRKLFESCKNPRQVVATGSSSFVPSRLAESYDAGRLIGVHFIYPVQLINTVEVVFGEKTPAGLVAKVCAWLQDIGKKPVSMDESIGCITTRVLAVLGNEAFRLHRQYQLSFQELDEIIDQSGYTPAPFRLNDMVGLDTIYHCLDGHFQGRPEDGSFSLLREFLKEKIEQGQLGKKSGSGFFCYEGDEGKGRVPVKPIPPEIIDNIVERIKTLYINSSLVLIEKGCVDCQELDRIFYEINGTEMGPVHVLFQEGAGAIVEKLRTYSREYGILFKPIRLLEYIAASAQGREDIDRQIRDFHLGGKKPGWFSENILR